MFIIDYFKKMTDGEQGTPQQNPSLEKQNLCNKKSGDINSEILKLSTNFDLFIKMIYNDTNFNIENFLNNLLHFYVVRLLNYIL